MYLLSNHAFAMQAEQAKQSQFPPNLNKRTGEHLNKRCDGLWNSD